MLLYEFFYLLCPVQCFAHIDPQMIFVTGASENNNKEDLERAWHKNKETLFWVCWLLS